MYVEAYETLSHVCNRSLYGISVNCKNKYNNEEKQIKKKGFCGLNGLDYNSLHSNTRGIIYPIAQYGGIFDDDDDDDETFDNSDDNDDDDDDDNDDDDACKFLPRDYK